MQLKVTIAGTKITKKNMKILLVLLLNLTIVSGGLICAKNDGDKRSNDPLPDTRPQNISFQLSMGGGMLYYYEDLFISGDSSYYLVNDGGAISKIYFAVSGEKLDKLYDVFRENDFDRIKTYDEKVYDRGGETVSLRWGKGKYASVSNSGMTFIKDSWKGEWSACTSALSKIIDEEIAKQKKDFEIRVDRSLFGKEIYIQLNRETVIPKSMVMSENGTDEYISRTVKLMPGSHMLSFYIGNKYQSAIISTDSSKGLNFVLKNDSLMTYSKLE